MAQVFVSHVEEDADIALRIADRLEEAGYGTWCYERHALPGPSYLLQTSRQIEASDAVVLVISPHSLGSRQVTAEVVRAHESARPFIPVLHDISHVEFAARQPEWREALGSATSIAIPPAGVEPILPRILDGLRGLGISPGDGEVRPAHVYTTPSSSTGAAATEARTARPTPGPRPRFLAGGVVAVVVLVAIGAVLLRGGGGSGDKNRAETVVTFDTTPATDPDSSATAGASGDTGSAEQFASASDTPLSTSAGTMRVAKSMLVTESCPPPGIPGGCLTASGSDRYLVLELVPASGGDAALSQVFLNEAHQSTLTFGGGRQAGNFRVSLDEQGAQSTIEIVYGVLSADGVGGGVLLRWPGNQPLLLTIS